MTADRTRGSERGTTLVEAVVAASLLLTLAGGVAYLFLLTHRFAMAAEQLTMAVAAATSRLETLMAVPWAYDLAGGEPEAGALDLSPPDVLDRNVAGFSDLVDATGTPVDGDSDVQPAFARRWALLPLNGDASNSRAIEVCTFAWPAPPGAPPLVCLASARTRQP
ncbi:MAG: hypothetical protein AB7Q16_06360 [Vicinamibacterales bacterium]